MFGPDVEANSFNVDRLMSDFYFIACMVVNPHMLDVSFNIKSIPITRKQVMCYYTAAFTVIPKA